MVARDWGRLLLAARVPLELLPQTKDDDDMDRTHLKGFATFINMETEAKVTVDLPASVPTRETWEATISDAIEAITPEDEAWELYDMIADEV